MVNHVGPALLVVTKNKMVRLCVPFFVCVFLALWTVGVIVVGFFSCVLYPTCSTCSAVDRFVAFTEPCVFLGDGHSYWPTTLLFTENKVVYIMLFCPLSIVYSPIQYALLRG